MQRVSIIGSNGQLGSDLFRFFSTTAEVQGLTHGDIEVAEIDSVRFALADFNPDVVINTAAFHNVALCESEPGKAHAINAIGATNVALAAAELGARSVYISTDYVFNGNLPKDKSYEVDAIPDPLNVYGKTKLEGEQNVLSVSDSNLVLRISSVFGIAGSSGKGGNFIEAILNKVTRGETASVVDDTYMSPTYAANAAEILSKLLDKGVYGIAHGASSNKATWFELAKEAAGSLGLADLVSPVSSPISSEFSRPVNSALSDGLLNDLGIPNSTWQESLSSYLLSKGHIN